MKVVLAADHRGFALKEGLKAALIADGHSIEDVGAFELNPEDDYPEFAEAGAQKIVTEEGSLGVFLCGSGMGMDIVANKVKGIRATMAHTKEEAIYARAHDDVNVITLPADTLNEAAAHEIALAFLSTPFSVEARHQRRVEEIEAIEDKDFR